MAFFNLGRFLNELGRTDEALAVLRKATELDPKGADSFDYLGLGNALHFLGQWEEAVAAYRRAAALDPKGAPAHHGLGLALQSLGQPEEAAAAYRRAIALDPKYALPHHGLGVLLHGQGRFDEAIAEVRQAMILDGEHVGLAPFTLAEFLRYAGRYGEAAATLRRLRERVKEDPDRVKQVDADLALVERQTALAPRLSDVLGGAACPAGAAELLELAQLASDRQLPAAATRLYAAALDADPMIAEDRQAQHRAAAACAAALAGCGQGKDDPPPGEATRAALRRQALTWLRAELAVWSKQVESGPPEGRPLVVETLRHWTANNDLVDVRRTVALARLPAAERAGWQTLWADVDALLRRAQKDDVRTPSPPAAELSADPFAH
jgi:tetratricopeptide (TPR) repeat protein